MTLRLLFDRRLRREIALPLVCLHFGRHSRASREGAAASRLSITM
jgi:hypothetical protein